MTDRKIMKLALEALETADEVGFWELQKTVVSALRERLAQPEQEPVAMYEDWYNTKSCGHCGMVGGHAKSCRHYTTPPAAPMTEFEEAVAAVDNTLHHAIDHWQDKASEQAALLRECRAALDLLIEKKPELSALLCGSTTLGNLRASLHDYRVLFDDTPPAAQPAMFGPMGTVGDLFDKHVIANGNLKKEWIVYLERNT